MAGCGGDKGSANGAPLAWDGTPKLTASPSGARVLIGTAKNDSSKVVYVRTPDVGVADQAGRRIRSSVAFVSGFVRSNYPRNGPLPRRPSRYPQKEQERIGYLAVLDPGETTPLTVSWQEPPGRRKAARIAYENASLAIPATATYSPP
jgi:hypothetical protein